ncbi:MAG TPA: beta-ketoacyl synthase N-terminal-like domain-containing protein [Draconibacterium sp.]|nr:beta-ketoacyl synthase N-terminal-like domain-containing protein [Draconibacterium sp.]
MQKITISGSNIISSLGFTSEENFRNVLSGQSGLKYQTKESPQPVSKINNEIFKQQALKPGLDERLTRFEKLCILSISDAVLQSSIDMQSRDCLIILATTKGNIGLLETKNERSKTLHLWESANKIAAYFQVQNKPLVVSNACVSSVLAQVVAMRMLMSKQYKNIVVCGADLISDFIISGFQSFKALSPLPCKPFDLNRNGLSLGEGAGTLVFTRENSEALFGGFSCLAGASSNDANHISGPSRTGDGLANAILSTLNQAKIHPGFISAHGTATPYNDEMEAKAIVLAGLQEVPVNSLKSFFGHTLGAAGIIETIITLFAMEKSVAIGTLGHEEYGVSEKINLIGETCDLQFDSFLKIASGFGGCNAAILYSK